ncbi:MAG: MFS transporter [Francisella endosymbiont of Hyalomma scupense]
MNSSPSLIEKLTAPLKEAKMFTMLILGYASGFPLMLTASSLFLWYKDNGIETRDIGFLTLIAIPYTFKYLWAPFLDKVKIPRLGRRKGWILLTQVLLVILIAIMSRFSPVNSPFIIAFIGFLICFVSATQDIAINAYQTEVLLEHERALGNAIAVMGYRIGMLVTGSLVLIIVDRLNNNWNLAWLMITPFFIICPLYTLLIKESQYQESPKSFRDAFVLPFVEFFKRQGLNTAIIIIIILISYKLADAIAFSLNSIFFIDLGFSKTTIAVSYKVLSLFASLGGLIVGGLIAKQIGIYKSFLYFSIIMACANLTYVLLAIVGKNYYLMLISVSVEYFCGAMGTAVLVAMIMSIVNVKFSATQFAILSSIDSLARVFVGPLAGYIQAHYRWEGLFIFSFIVGMFISLLIFISRTKIKLMANLH